MENERLTGNELPLDGGPMYQIFLVKSSEIYDELSDRCELSRRCFDPRAAPQWPQANGGPPWANGGPPRAHDGSPRFLACHGRARNDQIRPQDVHGDWGIEIVERHGVTVGFRAVLAYSPPKSIERHAVLRQVGEYNAPPRA